MREAEGIDAQTVILSGILGAVVVYGTIIGLQVLYYRTMAADLDKKYVQAGWAELRDIQTEQRTAISALRWVDDERKEARLPIERAMDLELKRLQEGG